MAAHSVPNLEEFPYTPIMDADEGGFLDKQRQSVLEEAQSIKERFVKGGTSIHVTTLDEVVSVNSFFTVAVFLGLSFTSSDSHSALNLDCTTGANAAKYLLVYEVVAFGFFLFSSLVAHGLKLCIIFANSRLLDESQAAEINNRLLRFGMLASAVGSVAGTVFLLLSMISIIEMRLGPFSCGSSWTESAALPLIVLTSSGLSIFISSVFYSFLH